MQEFLLGIVEITLGMSLLILLMLMLLKFIGGKFTAKCRYILWTLVMIRLAIPLGFGILPALIEVPVETEPEGKIIAVIPDMEMSAPPQIIRDPLIYSRDTPVDYIPVPSEPEPFASESVTEEPITWEDVKTYIPHIYLIGTAIFLLWNLLSYWIYTAKILHTAKEVYPYTQKIYEAVCRKKGLSRPPVLLVSPDVSSPAAFGLFRRRIVLPEIEFTENGLAGTLSHEVTHCRRGDLWIKAVCLLARALHWFNPLVHLAAFRCEMEMELSCDESVLAGCDENTRAAYGEVMLDIIKRCRRNRGALTTHFNPRKNAVKARFTNILYGSGKKRGLWLIAVCLVLCLIAGAIVACQTEEADIQDETVDERDSVLWTYALSDTEILSYGTDDNDVYYLYASGRDGGYYPLTEISLDLFQYGSNETLHETLPLHAVSTDTGYLFYLRYHIQHAYFYEFSLTREENRLVFDDIRMLTEDEAKELGIYSAEMVTITSLEELARYLADGIITQGLYDFYYDLLSGKSDIPEYNTLQIEDYTIRFTVPMTGYASYFSFTVTESGLDTLPPGTYDWQILDIREVTVSGRSANHSAYTDIPEVQKLFTFFDGYFAYNTPFFGEAMPHPAIHNYIIEHYGTNGSMDRDEYMQIAEAEFGITDFSSMRLEDWTDENGRLFSGGVGGGWYGEVTEVWEHEESENVHITIQFYADCNYLLKSHKIAYKFGYDGTWQGYSFVSRSVYEPGDMYFAEYGSVYEGITAGEGMQIPLAFPFADMTLTVPAVWENISIVKTSETGFDIYEKTANEYWNSRDKSNTGGGYVCTVAYYTKEEFAEVEAQFRESEGVDVYAEGFGHSVVLGTDANYVYTMVEATDVPWDGVPNPSEAQYKQIQYQMQTVLTTFMDENGITPNPLCPASIVYTPEIKDTILRETSGNYPTMEAYVTDRMAKETTAQYFAAEPDGSFSNKQKTANVTDTKLLRLEKKGELADLAPEGILECWEYKYLIKLDVPTEEVMIVGGQQEDDGWFDLEGQGNHTTVALRYPDGTYTVLRNDVVADGIDFTGYRNSYEEAIYDWYVTEYGLDLPLYVQDWINEITLPDTAIMGNQPVHRFDGEGWGIYIPISTWYQSTDAMENQWLWRSSYNTGSTLTVDVFSHSLEDEYVTAEKQGYTPADSTKRVWKNHTDGLHSCYYYYENPNGGFWRVTIEWTDEGVTNDNANIVIEPQILKLMAEKFVVFGAANNADNALTVTSPIYLCDDVYRSETTPTHGESTITFPDGLNGYKLYTCEVLLCTDGCDPQDVVWRNFFGYAGGYDLQEMELNKTGSYPAKLYLMEYPEDIVAQILSDMEKGGASEDEMLAYRNRRWYLYLLTVDADHYACIFLEPENMAARPENEQEILDALVASVQISMTQPKYDTELVSYPDTDRVFPVPEYWEEEQIAVLEYTSDPKPDTGNTPPVFSFSLYEWLAYTENDTGLVWILSAYTLEDFAETAEFWKNTHDTDVYTQIFSQAKYLLGTDTEYAYVLILPTDVQFLEKDPVSYQQYERLQISSQTVLGWFMEENGITPNPTCPASAVYAPAEETPEGIASAFLNRYLHRVYTFTETAFTEMMDPAYHTPIAYLQDKVQYLSYTRQARGEMAYDFDVEYYNTQSTIPAEKFLACSIRASIRFRKEPYGEMVNLEERYIVTLRETETGWLVTDMMQENDRFDGMYKANGFDLNALLTEFDTSLAGDPDTIWQTFLDTVVAPYEENISSKEFLDLDGNGIEELLLFDLGNGICEIYTIEGGEVKCLSAGQQGSGHSLLTIYHDNPTMLAPPSLGAGEYVFYASGTPEDVSKTRYKNWFIPSPVTGGYVLYSTYGNTVSRTDQYVHFYSGEDSVRGKFLCVAELSRFEREAINSNPALGWECWHQGEKVSKNQYMTAVQECWDILEQRYGVTYTEEETLHWFDELRKTPDTSFDLLADLLEPLKTENPQAYMSRTPYGEEDSDVLYPVWGFSGASNCARSLAVDYTFEPLTAMEVQETTRITLHSPTEGEWKIHGWVNSKYIELITGGRSYFFRAAYKDNSEICIGTTLQNWFDDAEYAAMPYQAVIPDTGQGFLAAAQTFVESWYGRNLQVSSGSEHAFSYVSCSVRDAQNRDHLIENGFIGENTYTYYITVIFVGENPHAGRDIKATVAGLYSGEDPTVPHNAYEFQLNGYITLEEDGWHGEVGGTGW